mgnify:CR=1 FL=1
MLLSKLLKDLKYTSDNMKDVEISSVETDSRLVKQNSLFVAFDGKTHKGIEFLDDVISNGVVAVVIENKYEYKNDNVVVIKVENPHTFAGQLLQNYYEHELPAHMMAVTGTKGKTSTAEFVRQILDNLNIRSASIGTLGVNCKEKEHEIKQDCLTNQELVKFYSHLHNIKANMHMDYAITEASSQGLDSGRLGGLYPEIVGFTSFSQDHLNYHLTMEDYFRCKMLLFGEEHCTSNTKFVINGDMKETQKIYDICRKNNCKDENILTFGYNGKVKLEKIDTQLNYQTVFFSFNGKKYSFKTHLLGEFQAMNLLCAFCFVYFLNVASIEDILKAMEKVKAAEGRMNLAAKLKNGASVYIDFAHTASSLECVLKTTNEHLKKVGSGRSIMLFGLGGERDATKRPIMGKVSQDLADFTIITNDNFRSEDPKQIRADIEAGMDKSKHNYINFDGTREEAIKYGIDMLQPNDILILAGKGQEKYTIEHGVQSYFNEFEIVENYIKEKNL